MNRGNPPWRKLALYAFVALLLLIGAIALVSAFSERDESPPKAQQQFGPNQKDPYNLPKTHRVDREYKEGSGDLAPEAERRPEDLRDESQDGQKIDKDALKSAQEDLLPPQPLGGAQNYSCTKRFGPHVYSAQVARAVMLILHYTVSRNVPGSSDVWSIVKYFERTRIASATFVVDLEGNCVQMVPVKTGKPWTQGNMNGGTCASWEIIGMGNEGHGVIMSSALIRKGILASMMVDVSRTCGVPLKYVDPVGCSPKAGFSDHDHLECGNDHVDIRAWNILRDIQKQLDSGPFPVLRPKHASWCRSLAYGRRVRHDWLEELDRIRKNGYEDGPRYAEVKKAYDARLQLDKKYIRLLKRDKVTC